MPSLNKSVVIVVGIVLMIAVIGGGYLWVNTSRSRSTTNCVDKTNTPEVALTYTADQQFAEVCIRVSAGTKLIYQNKSTNELQIGVDPHPLHTGNKEFSNNQFTLNVKPGETATVTLTTKGTFGIHNHLNSGSGTTIVVE